MKTITKTLKVESLSEFGERHNLTLEINERKTSLNDSMRYYVSFERVEIMESGILISTFGNGATVDDAMIEYAKQISCKKLVTDAYSRRSRYEFEAGRLYHKSETEIE